MFTLTKINLPDAIEVDGRFYKIKTDFRWWLVFCKALQEHTIESFEDVDYLYLWEKPRDREKGYKALLEFFRPEREIPRPSPNKNSSDIIFDYEIDAPYIYAAFMEQYHIDLLEPKLSLHWWKFNALFDGLHDTRLNEIIKYRCYDENDKSSQSQIYSELRQMWEMDSSDNNKVKNDLDEFEKKLRS